MGDAASTWEALDPPWQLALEEAWGSWSAGSAGVGAVVVDADGEVIAVGRNRMLDQRGAPGVLAATPLAHAEMNALAQLPMGSYGSCTIYTTFEPCLMCASTILQVGIGRVSYAAADPVFDGLHDWLGEFQFAAERLPARDCLGGPLGAFAHVLHLSWLAFWVREGHVIDAHRRLSPRHLDLAQRVAAHGHLADVAAAGGGVVDAAQALWVDLEALS